MAERKEQGGGPDDRRDSPRVHMRLGVRRAGSTEDFEARDGDLSLGGVAWHGPGLEVGAQVEVRFQLPGFPEVLQARGEVLQVTQGSSGSQTMHVRFVDLSMEAELAIARHLDDMRLGGGGR